MRTPTAFLICVCLALGADCRRSDCVIYASHLRCEYLQNPLSVDPDRPPRFSWWVESAAAGARNQSQSAYRIQVIATQPAYLAGQSFWDRYEHLELGSHMLLRMFPISCRCVVVARFCRTRLSMLNMVAEISRPACA